MSPKESFFSRLKHLRRDHRAKDSEKSKRKDDDPQGGTVASPTASTTSSEHIVSTSITGGGVSQLAQTTHVPASVEPQPQDTPSNTQCAASIRHPATAISTIPPTSPTAPHAPTASRTSTALSTAVASALPSPSERLWDRAYDELKDKESKESKWVNAYEKIMTRVLKEGDLSPTAPEPDENVIETDLAARRLQMNKLVEDGLKKTEKLANVMKGIGSAIRVIDSVKETIGKGIESVPYAGIAWAGVCIALQILKTPTDETTANRDGILYVCERMEWYWNLSNVQFEENVVDIRSLIGLRDRLEEHIIDLYKALLLYQIKSVLSYYRNQGLDFLRNLFKSDDWDGSLESVQDAEDIFRQDLAVYNEQLKMSYIKRKLRQNLHKEDRLILDWLTKTTYGPKQTDNFSRRQKGTGRWLLESDEFLKWRVEAKQTLFCPGIPGAGKTVLTSTVVNDLRTKFRNDDSVGIAYLYCEFNRQDQKPIDLLLSLLRQLIQRRPPVPENLKSLYEQHSKDDTELSFGEVSQILEFIVHTYSRAFIIIDALDECQVSEGGRNKFLLEIFNLQTKTGANVFATSRPILDIIHEFEKQKSTSLPVRASDEDIRTYLDPRMLELPSFVRRSPSLQEKIKAAVLEAADGMFLLAKLHVDSLIGKRNPNALEETLKTLPTKLSGVYEQAMERIEGDGEDARGLAKQVLSWITCAQRPLTKLELRHALGVKIGASKLDNGDLSEIEDMVSVCAGLVTVDEESDVIRLVHYTTQEYLERTLTSWCPNAHADITKICVTYLSFDAFTSGFCQTDKKFETQLQSYVLYDYAAQNWGHHAREASTQATMELEHLTLKFLRNEAKVSASGQAMMASKSYPRYSQKVPRQLTGVHLAAFFGLDDITTALLKHGYHPDPKDTFGRTPLSRAAGNGHEAVVKLLLETEKVDVDSKDADGQTPLSRAARNGHEAVVKLLLETEKVDVDSKDSSFGQTPLSWAAESGHEAVVKLLLETKKADVDSKDGYGRTPLSRAAGSGHEAVVRLLLETEKVDVDSKAYGFGQTPLSWAAENGHEAVVKLLLETEKADVGSKAAGGRTPLSLAAGNGHEAVVRLLLETEKVDVDSKASNGQTPLSWAAENGHEAVVRLLLETEKVDVDSKAAGGRTPLSRAAGSGHEAVVRLLLETEKADVDSKAGYGRTPLSWAAGNGHEAVVKQLLETEKVDVDSKASNGQTPLSRAAGNGHEAVVKLLLETEKVDVDSKASNGQTPLSRAAENGHEAVVRLLLETEKVDVDSKDSEYGRTPLSWAAENGHEAVVKLLENAQHLLL